MIDRFKVAVNSLMDEMPEYMRPELVAFVREAMHINLLTSDDLVDIPDWESDISHSAARFVEDAIDDIKSELDDIVTLVWDIY